MPNATLLETFATPSDAPFVIEHVAEEFTSVCPMTGHPDFGAVTLRYQPRAGAANGCVELKSLKLYLWSYRNEGAFHEAVVNRILDDFTRACRPRKAVVVGDFNVRGGIHTTVRVEYRQA